MTKIYSAAMIGPHVHAFCCTFFRHKRFPIYYGSPETSRALAPRLDLANKSPSGFGYGHIGPGASQLSLAILADYTRDGDLALRNMSAFVRDVISKWDYNKRAHSITSDEVQEWLNERGLEVDMAPRR